jgi:hypothetical protein
MRKVVKNYKQKMLRSIHAITQQDFLLIAAMFDIAFGFLKLTID